MEILGVLVLIVLVPLAMIVFGMKLIGGAGSSLAQTRREWKDFTAESFAQEFFFKTWGQCTMGVVYLRVPGEIWTPSQAG